MSTSDLESFQKLVPKENWSEHYISLWRLLRPIKWDMGSRVESRQSMVHRRRLSVHRVKPFLDGMSLDLANQWLDEERHEELWD